MKDFIEMSGGTFSLTTNIKNPFRKDNNPTCSIYYSGTGTLLFKDHNPKYSAYNGDCFHVVRLYLVSINYLNATNFIEVLKYIDRHYKLGLQPTSFDVSNVIKLPNLKRSKKTPEEYRQNVEFRYEIYANFKEHHLNYFSQYYVEESTLLKHRVSGVKKFFYGTRFLYKTWEDSTYSPLFKYEIPEYKLSVGGKLLKTNKYFSQVYRPLSRNKKDKFRTNAHGCPLMNFEKVIHSPDKTLLFITSSMKDVLVLYELGINAVCPIGEGINIPNYYLDELEKYYSKIVVNYDSDEAGQIASSKLCERRNYENFTVFGNNIKDISDYVKENGKAAGKHLLENFIKPPF